MYIDEWILEALGLLFLSIPALGALSLFIGFIFAAKAQGIGVSKGWLVIGSVMVLLTSIPAVRFICLNVM